MPDVLLEKRQLPEQQIEFSEGCGKVAKKLSKKVEKRMKKGVDKWESICYYNQALKRVATPETK